MPFQTTKQKIQKLWEQAEKNTISSNNQIIVNRTIHLNVDIVNQLYYTEQIYLDLSTDWTDFEVITANNDGDTTSAWLNWTITFSSLREDIFNKLMWQVVYKSGNGISDTMFVNTQLHNGLITQINGTNGSIRVTAVIDRGAGIQSTFQAKLLLFVFNPNLYYKS